MEDQALRHLRNRGGADVRHWLEQRVAARRAEAAPLEAAAEREREALARVDRTMADLLADLTIDVRGDVVVVRFTVRADERRLSRLAPLRPVRGRNRGSCTTSG